MYILAFFFLTNHCSNSHRGVICDISRNHLVELRFISETGDDKQLTCDTTKWSSDRVDMQAFGHLDTLIFRGQVKQSNRCLAYFSYIYFHRQAMHGKLPSSLGDLPILSRLDMSGNKLIGGLGDIFGNETRARNLRLLDLSRNELTGKPQIKSNGTHARNTPVPPRTYLPSI